MKDCQMMDWAPEYATRPDLAEKLWKSSQEICEQIFRVSDRKRLTSRS